MGSIPDELRQVVAILDNLRRYPLDIAAAESDVSNPYKPRYGKCFGVFSKYP